MDSFIDIAMCNKKNDRRSTMNDVLKKSFRNYTSDILSFVYSHKTTLVHGRKDERIKAAHELQRLSNLFNEDQLYLTQNIGSWLLDDTHIAGTLEEITKICDYESIDEYTSLVNEAINSIYERDIYHYTDYIDESKSLKPLSRVDSPSSTTDASYRANVEQDLGIIDCIYATTTTALENIYGTTKLLVNPNDYTILYHIGDTLENARCDYYYAQRPFKKGSFDIYQHKLIPKKEQLLELGAESLAFHTIAYGTQIIEVLLLNKTSKD